MPTVSVPINDAHGTVLAFVNAEGSGWMRSDHWDLWRSYMAGDHQERDRGRRHKPGWNAWAAGLITGATPEEAENVAREVYEDAKEEWQRKHGFGRVIDQFVRHLEFHHAVGTIALYFIPYIGPFLAPIAKNFDPMVEAAAKNAVAKHEAGNVSQKFRAEYYDSMDRWLAGEADLPAKFLDYHAEVVVPAALEVREQIASGVVETESGSYPLDRSGWDLWSSRGGDPGFEYIGGFFGRIEQARIKFASDLHMQPGRVAAAFLVGALSGVGLHLDLRGVA